ncbi:MAG: InlB B-repeat-containing protein, partial [Thermoplasmata archaeon]
YSYTIASSNKKFAPTQYSGSFTVNGASITINVKFALVTYSIIFKESGLPSGTQWSVTLNGVIHNSTTNMIIFSEPNGSYSYTITTPINGSTGIRYVTLIPSGTTIVNGANATIDVSYETQYYLTMLASPENGGSVSPTGGWYNAGSSVTINAIPNSNYEFVSWTGTGTGSYSGTSTQVTITMNGPITEQANFIELFQVTFTETGLPAGTLWYVNLSNGQSYRTTGNSIGIQIPNGSYSYTIAATNKEYSAQGGLLIVNGSNMEISIKFSLVTYAITFTESGLCSGTSWSVTLNNMTKSSTNGTIIFNE